MELTYKPLTGLQLQTIINAALELLVKYGIEIESQWACELFSEFGCTVDNKTVKIPRKIILNALKTVPKEFTLHARNEKNNLRVKRGSPPVMIPACGGIYIRDENGERRASTKQDFINLLKLCHVSEICNVTCSTVTYPGGYDTKELFPWQIATALAVSDKPLYMHSSDADIAITGIEMAKKVTGRNDVCVAMGNVNSLSPMKWDETMLNTLKVFAQQKQPVVIGCCSLMGITSHLFLENTLITNVAEVLTGITISQLIMPGAPVIFAGTSGVANMSNMQLSLGAPQTATYAAAIAQIGEYLDIPHRTGGALTDAKEMDMQAGLESSLMLLTTITGGSSVVLHSLGSMECFNSVDYLKWIMDEEIIARIRLMTQTVPDILGEAVDVCGNNGTDSYLEHDDTLDCFHERFYNPPVSDSNAFDIWNIQGLNNIEKAKKIYHKMLNGYIEPDCSENVKELLKEYINLI